MSTSKILIAAFAAATVGLAFAQGTPPKPAANPAVGAGQQSSQNTPMGTTGTPSGGGGMAQGSTRSGGSSASSAASSGAMSSGSSAGSTGSSAGSTGSSGGSTMAADTGSGSGKSSHRKHRKARADRN
jgi:hypothetical protein